MFEFSVFRENSEGRVMATACPSEQDLKKKSIFIYHRVLLFNHDVQEKKPFSSFNRNMFSEEDIPKSWFTGPLSRTNRRKVLSLPSLGGGRYSVFAKIEIGMSN